MSNPQIIREGDTVEVLYKPTGETFTTKAHKDEFTNTLMVLGWVLKNDNTDFWDGDRVRVLSVTPGTPPQGSVIQFGESPGNYWSNSRAIVAPRTRVGMDDHLVLHYIPHGAPDTAGTTNGFDLMDVLTEADRPWEYRYNPEED